jgi:hypothetical protein
MGPIQAGDGLTIPQFVAKAFNDELKFAFWLHRQVWSFIGVRLVGLGYDASL